MDVRRIYKKDLVGLNQNGSPCEVCGNHMHDHEWADLDENGLAINCSEKEN